MKLPLTDKFLWDMYNILEKGGNVIRKTIGPRRTIVYGLLSSDKNPFIEKYRKEQGRRKFSKLIHRLKRSNYISVENLKNKKAIMLTREGLSKALKASFYAEKRTKRKDGKWIMLMFDIPQNNKVARSLLKSILLNLGYRMFQQSVWITSYDVSKETEKLLQLHSLDEYVKIFLIEGI